MTFKHAFAGLALAAVVLAGCSDDDSGSSSSADKATTTTANAECAARDSLKTSVKGLADPSLLTGGKAGIQSAVDQVSSDLDDVVSTTKDANQSDVDATKAALTDLKSAVSAMGDGSLTANLQAVGNALAKVGTTGEKLVSSLGTDC
jgi:hypothetical protein